MNNNSKLFYCYSNRLNQFLSLFGFNYTDKGENSKGQEYKAYKRSKDLDFALKEWEILKNKFPVEKVKKQLVNV